MTRAKRALAVLAAVEFSLASLSVYAAAYLQSASDVPIETPGWMIVARAFLFGGAVVVAVTAMGLYAAAQRLGPEGVLIRLVLAVSVAALGEAFIHYLMPTLGLPPMWLLITCILAISLIGASRVIFSRLADQDLFRRRVIVYGAGKHAAKLLQLRRRSDQRGFQIVAFVPVPSDVSLIEDPRVDSSGRTLIDLAEQHSAEEIVVAVDDRRQSFPVKELLECKFAGINVVDLVGFLERESGKISVDLMSPSWMIYSDGFTRRSSRMVISRTFDVLVSVLLLALSWPIMVLTALAILIEDGRPVFYRQMRVGMLGTPFELMKFRSMTKNAELGTGARWAQKDDSRITKVGARIRKWRIDELPQLFNILRGDMRFIGPRPERPEFVDALAATIPYYHERHSTKPGLTGWAQLCYPYGSSEKDALEKLQFDLYYVKNQSLIFDLIILLQTVEVVIWGKGAR